MTNSERNGSPLFVKIGHDSEIRPIDAPRTNNAPQASSRTDNSEVTLFTGSSVNISEYPSFKKLFEDVKNGKI